MEAFYVYYKFFYFKNSKIFSISNIGPVITLISDNESTETYVTLPFILTHKLTIYKCDLVKYVWCVACEAETIQWTYLAKSNKSNELSIFFMLDIHYMQYTTTNDFIV